MNGFLIIDKPAGVTSFDIVRKVRRWCKIRKVGHAGTLDPMATGVLPVAVGQSTRLIEYLMSGKKVYQATMKLGASTDTQDAEGQVLEERDWQNLSEKNVCQVVKSFIGEVEQLPPMYSALKKDGQPLYKLARQGIEVERKPRTIVIDKLTIDEVALPFVTFTVECSKGTYIRTVCHDIGEQLGCGGHMTALRRLACGDFDISHSHSPDELQTLADEGRALPLLAPVEALEEWLTLTVEGPALQRLRDGVAPAINEIHGEEISAGDRVKFVVEGELLALANCVPGGYGKRPGDFELLKVFPQGKES